MPVETIPGEHRSPQLGGLDHPSQRDQKASTAGVVVEPPTTDLGCVVLGDQSLEAVLETVVGAATELETVSAASVVLLTDRGIGLERAPIGSGVARAASAGLADEGLGEEAAHRGRELSAHVPQDRRLGPSTWRGDDSVRTVWSIPLIVKDAVIGALTLYSSNVEPWEHRAAGSARRLAAQAGVLLANAAALARARREAENLSRALESRTVIAQAQGLLMARQKVSSEEAFSVLVRASQRTNRKLRDVAATIVAGHHDRLNPRRRPASSPTDLPVVGAAARGPSATDP